MTKKYVESGNVPGGGRPRRQGCSGTSCCRKFTSSSFQLCQERLRVPPGRSGRSGHDGATRGLSFRSSLLPQLVRTKAPEIKLKQLKQLKQLQSKLSRHSLLQEAGEFSHTCLSIRWKHRTYGDMWVNKVTTWHTSRNQTAPWNATIFVKIQRNQQNPEFSAQICWYGELGTQHLHR